MPTKKKQKKTKKSASKEKVSVPAKASTSARGASGDKSADKPEEKKEAPSRPTGESSGRASKKSNGKKILIVEDERPLAHALDLKFSHEGFETTVTTDGAEGLKAAQSGKYHVILLDIIMPQMDGFTFLEKLGKKKAKVIILSNLGQEEDKEKALKLGAVAYYVKSNTPITEIVKKVKSAM